MATSSLSIYRDLQRPPCTNRDNSPQDLYKMIFDRTMVLRIKQIMGKNAEKVCHCALALCTMVNFY